MPAMPTTEPTAPRGNMSDVSVNMLHDHPWCAAAARLISATASHKVLAFDTSAIGATTNAHLNFTVFGAAFTGQPCVISRDETHRPKSLPISDAEYTATGGNPTLDNAS